MSQLGQNAVRSHHGQMAFVDLADIPASGIVRKIFEVITVKRPDLPCQRHRDLQFLMQNLDPQFHAFLAAILHSLVPNITKDKEKDVQQDPKSGSSPQNNDSPPTPTP